mmetsp:Transcript_155253/g.498103  ORF Transcript_155253/g.498103 Transcript_155253/m.498103 type:complete len:234 (-) Transcript_155253:1877-2578(-)
MRNLRSAGPDVQEEAHLRQPCIKCTPATCVFFLLLDLPRPVKCQAHLCLPPQQSAPATSDAGMLPVELREPGRAPAMPALAMRDSLLHRRHHVAMMDPLARAVHVAVQCVLEPLEEELLLPCGQEAEVNPRTTLVLSPVVSLVPVPLEAQQASLEERHPVGPQVLLHRQMLQHCVAEERPYRKANEPSVTDKRHDHERPTDDPMVGHLRVELRLHCRPDVPSQPGSDGYGEGP